MRGVVAGNPRLEAPIHAAHIALLQAPVARAEEVDAVEDVQQAHVGPFGRPDDVMLGIHLPAYRRPGGERSPFS
jgi:hypothetical protein